MALYIQFIKYTSEAAKGVLETGMVAREATMKDAVEAAGGTLHGFWTVEGGRWHVAALAEWPDGNTSSPGVLQAYAAGSWADHELLQITSPAEFDAASPIAYPPPGRS